jgi:hypothetical protein
VTRLRYRFLCSVSRPVMTLVWGYAERDRREAQARLERLIVSARTWHD